MPRKINYRVFDALEQEDKKNQITGTSLAILKQTMQKILLEKLKEGPILREGLEKIFGRDNYGFLMSQGKGTIFVLDPLMVTGVLERRYLQEGINFREYIGLTPKYRKDPQLLEKIIKEINQSA